jgi:transposase
MTKKTNFKISKSTVEKLQQLIKKGTLKARVITRARVLLYLFEGKGPKEIGKLLNIVSATIHNIKTRYKNDGLDAALYDLPRPGQPLKFSGKDRAQITALACTNAPEGHARWSLTLIAEKVVELGYVESISHTHVGRILKKTKLNRTSKNNGASH